VETRETVMTRERKEKTLESIENVGIYSIVVKSTSTYRPLCTVVKFCCDIPSPHAARRVANEESCESASVCVRESVCVYRIEGEGDSLETSPLTELDSVSEVRRDATPLQS
jgi:hypothetical protein